VLNPKVIIAVKSCLQHRDRGDHNLIRSLWGQDAKAAGIVVKFFVGQQDQNSARVVNFESDEVRLACPDDYNSLPKKTREICKWTQGKMLDFAFLCDTDTFINIRKFRASPFTSYDYFGHFNGKTSGTFRYEAVNREGEKEMHQRAYPWASGGYGYFLSRAALNEVAYAYPSSWAEDLQTGQTLGALAAEGKITIGDSSSDPFTDHFPSSRFGQGYDEKVGYDWMRKKYAESK
jgi:hypothetical protein